MATDNKSSILVDELLPEFLETEGPKFKAFVRAYYEFLETTGQITERSKNLLNYADIDKTEAEFVKHFDREILANFPQEILANRSLVAARIKELYRAKGSQQAYKMLFRMLFDDEIEFYSPGEDILRVSDGRWVQETSIRLSAPFVGDLFTIGGRNVVGLTSGATAIVERVVKTFEQGVEVFELFVGNVRGAFEDTEIVQTSDGNLSGVVLSSIGPLTGVLVDFGGSFHRVQDRVSFLSSSGVGGQGIVLQVEDSSVIPLIIDGGSGFTVNAIVTVTGGSGSGADFKVDSISNTEVLFTYNDTISGIANTSIEANTFGSSNTTTISANLAIADANTVISAALGTTPLTVGTISAMSAITRGSGYSNTSLPTVQVIEPAIAEQFLDDGSGGIKGFNANVVATTIGGSIVSVSVDTIGAGYARIDPITIFNLTRDAQNATGSGLVTGFIESVGKYTDTKGFISWNNRLQDNFYYQQFSYVIRSEQLVDTYREIVKKLLHPAGTNLFGDLLIQSNASIIFSSNTFITYAIEFAFVDAISSTLSFGDTEFIHIIDPASIASTAVVDINNELVHIIDYSSIASVLSIPNHELQLTIDNINVPTTTFVPIPGAFQLGNGTITNFFVNTIDDLSTEQIAKYGNLTINSVPGNKIFDGINTTFTTQLVSGSIIIVIDVNNTNEEFVLVVDIINDNTTLSVTSNVLYSNSSFAIVNNAIYLYS